MVHFCSTRYPCRAQLFLLLSSAMPSLLAFGALSVAHHVTQMSAELRVCRVCKQTYTAATNGPRACRYHSGRWMGAENSKHYGGGPASASTPYPRGVSHFWDCEFADILYLMLCTDLMLRLRRRKYRFAGMLLRLAQVLRR